MIIYIGNLSKTASEQHIRELFEEFGKVSDVIIVMDEETSHSKLYGYVLMENEVSGKEAIAYWNNRNFMNNYLEVYRASYDVFKGGQSE